MLEVYVSHTLILVRTSSLLDWYVPPVITFSHGELVWKATSSDSVGFAVSRQLNPPSLSRPYACE